MLLTESVIHSPVEGRQYVCYSLNPLKGDYVGDYIVQGILRGILGV